MTWTRNRPEGMLYRDADQSWDGLTLFCSVTGHHATLLNPEGEIVHRWHHSEGIQHAKLLENGHLLIHTKPFRHSEGRERTGGSAGALMELDWDSNVLWAYRNPAMHHDFARLPGGNHVVLTWYPVPDKYRCLVQGGHHHESEGDVMWGDVILEVDCSGREVSRWNSWEHFDPALDVICPLESHKEWSHANSLSITPQGDYLVSFRLTSQVLIIDRHSGAIKWRYGTEDERLEIGLSHQHAATWLNNGNILIFDNGCHRPRAPSFSRIIEVNPESREIEWKYQADVMLAFYSFMCSGASRLPNGNTFITEAATGRLFEVTPAGETVWEYVSPFTYRSRFGHSPVVFRSYRYALDDARFGGRELDPANHSELNELIRTGYVPYDYAEPIRRR
ncbi:MAG: aryl sulfotransferase [Gammaproteobacteria bacterium]|nr:aryl sulfotransferase [Gammaproteobacteria bacterium]